MDTDNRIYELEKYIKDLKSDLRYLGTSGNTKERERIIALITQTRDIVEEQKRNREQYKNLVEDYNKYLRAYTELVNAPTPDVNKLIELQIKIQDNDFARNKIKGIVDEEVLSEDKEILRNCVDFEQELEEKKNEKSSLEKQNKLLESLDSTEETKKKKEILLKKINLLEKRIAELEKLYGELEKYKPGTPEYDAILQKIEKSKKSIERLGNGIRKLSTELRIPRTLSRSFDFSNLDQDGLKELKENVSNFRDNMDKDLIKEKLKVLDSDIKNRENINAYQQMKKNKILLKYGIPNGDIGLLDTKVAEIRSKRNPIYSRNQMQMLEQNPIQSSVQNPVSNTDRAQASISNSGTQPRQTQTPMQNAGIQPRQTQAPMQNTEIQPRQTQTPMQNAGTQVKQTQLPKQSVVEKIQQSNIEIPEQEQSSNLPMELNLERKTLFEISGVDSSNIKEYLRNPSMEKMQRINNGKLYRFEKEDDKLIYIEEDIQEKYLNNPKKALKNAVKDLRKRLIKEYGKKGVKKFADYLEKENKELGRLFQSNNVFKFRYRGDAIDAYARAIGKGAGGELKQAKMAMALNSIVLMEDVKETLQKVEEPYKGESDLIVRVEKGKIGILPPKLSVRREPEFIQSLINENKPREAIETDWLPDGTVRTNFLIKPSDFMRQSVEVKKDTEQKRSRVRERKEKEEEMSI